VDNTSKFNTSDGYVAWRVLFLLKIRVPCRCAFVSINLTVRFLLFFTVVSGVNNTAWSGFSRLID